MKKELWPKPTRRVGMAREEVRNRSQVRRRQGPNLNLGNKQLLSNREIAWVSKRTLESD
jgi:hypothetical protein